MRVLRDTFSEEVKTQVSQDQNNSNLNIILIMTSGVYTRTKENISNLRLSHIGIKHTEKTKMKISSTQKERFKNPENHPCFNKIKDEERREKIRIAQIGENNSNFRGWKTQLHSLIRTSNKYKKWRISVFEKDNYTCQNCFKTNVKLEAHHKDKSFQKLLGEFLVEYHYLSPVKDKGLLIRLTKSYTPFWNINNGETLCDKCHDLI